MKYKIFVLLSILFFGLGQMTYAQDLSAKEIIAKADEVLKGTTSSEAEMSMTVVRPDWQREVTMKSWSKGDDYSLILITGPARDKGTAFLKREKEMWNWQPTIERVVKMPPSMMGQSWMGSDVTNDDLVRQSSTVNDFSHKILGEEELEGRNCWIIELIPHEDAVVVWGKIKTWVDQEDFLQLKTEFYDEDEYLVNTMTASNIKEVGGKTLATKMEIIPAEDEGNKTVLEYKQIVFDQPIKESFFSLQNMKRIR